MRIRNSKNSEFEQEVEIRTESGTLGLDFESQGGNGRNQDYRIALITIIERLKRRNSQFRVYLNSRPSKEKIPNIIDREVQVLYSDTSECIQRRISKGMISLGGANNSCLFIQCDDFGHNEWLTIVNDNEPVYFNNMVAGEELDSVVDALIPIIDFAPDGDVHPEYDSNSRQYKRNPYVKAFVLKLSKWICECCRIDAPFIKENGFPYLEVHHIRHLANQGSDRIQNAVALCPNCHRRMHYGSDKSLLIERLFSENARLVKE
jgi:5-methylcytosine-specific restriction endonuclease McrA